MKNLPFIFGTCVIFAALIIDGTNINPYRLYIFINVPTISLIWGGGLFLSLAIHGHTALIKAFVFGLSEQKESHKQAQSHITVLSSLHNIIMGLGFIGGIAGVILCWHRLDDPKSLGPALALSYLSVLYAIILSQLFVKTLINRASMTQAAFGNQVSTDSSWNAIAILFGICFIGVVGSLIIFLSFAKFG